MRAASKKLVRQLVDPTHFFESVRSEGWKPSFVFFLWITLCISLITALLNAVGMESTDFSSSCQAQIAAFNLVKQNLAVYGTSAYLIEVMLIFGFAVLILGCLTALLHVVYRLIGGQGSIVNAWKATCYGMGPCLLGGFLPYVALFAAFYSFAMQFYLGPKTLYNVGESRAIAVFTSFIALSFIEMFVFGTTVGWP